MIHRKEDNIKGFTIIEMTLAMTFISILLLAIVFLTLQIGSIYNKGMTIREANQAGQVISSEIQRSLSASKYTDISIAAAQLPDTGGDLGGGGRLCSGGTVYAWNYPEKFGGSNNSTTNFLGGGSPAVRFVKFDGAADDYCMRSPTGWKEIPAAGTTEILEDGTVNLGIYTLDIDEFQPADDPTQVIFLVKMTLGTAETGLIEDGRCKGEPKDDDWCAINQFTFTARSYRQGGTV